MLFAPAVDKNGSGLPASSAGVLPSDESSSSSSSSGASDAYPSPAFSDSLSLPDVDSSSAASDPSRPAKSSAGKRSKRKKGGSHKDDGDEDDESSTTYRMSRDRAPSVGLDGPLFGDETDGATTPGTDSDASDYMSAARGSLPGADDFAGHNRSLRGDGVPRGGVQLGLTEVNSRPTAAAAASSATATDE